MQKLEELEAQVRDLRAVLLQDRNEPLAITFRLPPNLAKLMGLMMALPKVTGEMVEQRLEIATNVKVAVHRLRAKLAPHNIRIESQYGVGYWLTPDMKAQVRRVVSEAMADPADEQAA